MEEGFDQDHHGIWAEKYRPKTFETFLGSESVKETINIFMAKNEIPHLLFHGPPGTGKTSLGKLLIKKIPCDHLMVNASDENRVDDVRYKVQEFAVTMGNHPLKVMFLDECLEENTLVWVLRDGKEVSISIKDVDPKNDLVRSLNIEKNSIEWRPFILIDQGTQEVFELILENGEIVICTASHKWYVLDSDGKVIRKKTEDIIKDNDNYILTTEDNRFIPDSQ